LNFEGICLLGLLRSPEQLESALNLLADPVREQAERTLSSLKPLPKAELLQRWSRLREEEWAAMGRAARERAGVALDDLAPALRLWVASWLVDQHG
jgi:hypothetical protein